METRSGTTDSAISVQLKTRSLTRIALLSSRSGAPTTAFADQAAIQALFPHTYGAPSVHIVAAGEEGSAASCSPGATPMRLGIVLSGGPASGGHNVISGCYDFLTKRVHKDSMLYGFLDGPSGLIDAKYIEVTAELLAKFRNQGGFHLLGSGRTKIETPEHFAKTAAICAKLALDGLIVVGGGEFTRVRFSVPPAVVSLWQQQLILTLLLFLFDRFVSLPSDDSNTNAALIAEFFKKTSHRTRCVGCPKTIDGDLRNEFIEMSFGFDTGQGEVTQAHQTNPFACQTSHPSLTLVCCCLRVSQRRRCTLSKSPPSVPTLSLLEKPTTSAA